MVDNCSEPSWQTAMPPGGCVHSIGQARHRPCHRLPFSPEPARRPRAPLPTIPASCRQSFIEAQQRVPLWSPNLHFVTDMPRVSATVAAPVQRIQHCNVRAVTAIPNRASRGARLAAGSERRSARGSGEVKPWTGAGARSAPWRACGARPLVPSGVRGIRDVRGAICRDGLRGNIRLTISAGPALNSLPYRLGP